MFQKETRVASSGFPVLTEKDLLIINLLIVIHHFGTDLELFYSFLAYYCVIQNIAAKYYRVAVAR